MTVDEVEMDQIGKATIADQPALTETLAQAFQTDPALSWISPDPAPRTRALRGLFRTLVTADMRSGLALRSVNDEAAALWRAPGRATSAMPELQRTVNLLVATLRTALHTRVQLQDGKRVGLETGWSVTV